MRKPDTIAFMVRTPLTQRDYDRFGIELIKAEGYQVYVLDLTAILNPRYLQQYSSDNLIEFDGIIKFKSKSEFKNFLHDKWKNIFIVDLVCANYSSLFIYKYFRKFDILYASFCANGIPMPSLSGKRRSFFQIIKDKLPRLCSRDGINVVREYVLDKSCQLVCRQLQHKGIIKAPDYILAGGRKVLSKYPLPDEHTKTIWAHTLDFDILLQQKTAPSRGNYAVFIDEYVPYHPDFIISKMGKIDADLYYKGLNRFFDWFERKFDRTVVIAAHPRSRYDQKPQCFGARKIIKGKTAECIAGADYVLTHGSTSINFAVYLKKPIVFLTCDEFERTFHGSDVTFTATSFGQKPINVDRSFDDLHIDFNFDERLYMQYVEDYIKTSTSARKPSWKIVIDELNMIAG